MKIGAHRSPRVRTCGRGRVSRCGWGDEYEGNVRLRWKDEWSEHTPPKTPANCWDWQCISAICLPADHAHYTTPASTPAPLDEAAQAAIALVRGMNDAINSRGKFQVAHNAYAEARRIADLPSFPKTVDPLLLIDRDIAADHLGEQTCAEEIRKGKSDSSVWVNSALAALRRGIELGKEGKA